MNRIRDTKIGVLQLEKSYFTFLTCVLNWIPQFIFFINMFLDEGFTKFGKGFSASTIFGVSCILANTPIFLLENFQLVRNLA